MRRVWRASRARGAGGGHSKASFLLAGDSLDMHSVPAVGPPSKVEQLTGTSRKDEPDLRLAPLPQEGSRMAPAGFWGGCPGWGLEGRRSERKGQLRTSKTAPPPKGLVFTPRHLGLRAQMSRDTKGREKKALKKERG